MKVVVGEAAQWVVVFKQVGTRQRKVSIKIAEDSNDKTVAEVSLKVVIRVKAIMEQDNINIKIISIIDLRAEITITIDHEEDNIIRVTIKIDITKEIQPAVVGREDTAVDIICKKLVLFIFIMYSLKIKMYEFKKF